MKDQIENKNSEYECMDKALQTAQNMLKIRESESKHYKELYEDSYE